ncbi:MAG: GYD domain-containing protein, partial [Candidatus Aminicenantes bacterium]|nr:GYD domain-containing protein [Candidatus Aminicenantes bacterium]
KWLAHYALLGPYDFMDIYEADSNETATRISMITRANGALSAESWPAMNWSHFVDIIKELV